MGLLDSNTDRTVFAIGAIIIIGLISLVFMVTLRGENGMWGKVQEITTDLVYSGSDILHDDPQSETRVDLTSRVFVYYVDDVSGERLGGVQYTAELSKGESYQHQPPNTFRHKGVDYHQTSPGVISGVMGDDNVTLTVSYAAQRQTLRIRYIDEDTGNVIPGKDMSYKYKENEPYNHMVEKSFEVDGSLAVYDLIDPQYVEEDPDAVIYVEGVMGESDKTIDILFREKKYMFSVYYINADGVPLAGIMDNQLLKVGESYHHVAPPSIEYEGETLYAVDDVNVIGSMPQGPLSVTIRYDVPGVQVRVFYRDSDGSILGSSQYGGSFKVGDSYSYIIPSEHIYGGKTYKLVDNHRVQGTVGTEPIDIYVDFELARNKVMIYYEDEDGVRLGPIRYDEYIANGSSYMYTADDSITTPDGTYVLREGYDPVITGTMGLNDIIIKVPYVRDDSDIVGGVLAGGNSHSLALKADGSIVSWGNNNWGQISNTPPGNDFVSVAVGAIHSLALKADGSIVSWGNNNWGQISNTPSGNDFVAIAGGGHHSLALKADGSIVVWGNNDNSQVSNTPSGNNFVAIAGGGHHSLAVKSDGTLAIWGNNIYGQSNTPTYNDFVAVAGGMFHSIALRADGSIVSWGSNANGKVSNTPSGNNFVAIAGGDYHFLALKSDGSIVSWGWDAYGQVSDTPSGNDFR